MSSFMKQARWGILAIWLTAIFGTSVSGQDKDKEAKSGEKKPATIEILVPDTRVEVKFEGEVTKQRGTKRVFKTPPLEPGKTYTYKVEVTIEPNNYTKILRNRDVTFKAGETVTLDLREKDPNFKDDVRIRWVPTPDDIVEEMCKLAKIGKDDIVYDLGCGDAVTICIAVKKFGAKKGIGIDIDPEKVKMAKDKAKEMQVDKQIEIREGNILKVGKKDIGDCTVMMSYLGDEMNIRLRPILLDSLKPGTRIVSHRFTMGEWKPEKTVTVMGQDGDEYTLHLWIVPEKKPEFKDDKK